MKYFFILANLKVFFLFLDIKLKNQSETEIKNAPANWIFLMNFSHLKFK